MLLLDPALLQGAGAAITDTEKLAEVSGRRSLLGGFAASGQKAARDIDFVKAAMIERWLAHGCALEEERGRMGEAVPGVGRSLGQQEDEWKAAMGDLHTKEWNEVKEVLGNLESRYGRQLRDGAAVFSNWKKGIIGLTTRSTGGRANWVGPRRGSKLQLLACKRRPRREIQK
jgi:hypothetical protein